MKYDECNRCETVAYHQAKDNGAKTDKEARDQARPAGRLWRATAVPLNEPERR